MKEKKAVLFVNLKKENAEKTAREIEKELRNMDYKTTFFSFNGKPENPPLYRHDIAFSVGGDGTVLYTARCLAPFEVPVLPVNIGYVGFISGGKENWKSIFKNWEKEEVSVSDRIMLEVEVIRESKTCTKNICLNDAVISASGIAKLINLDVSLNDITPVTSLGSYRCDGLIVATPTGSTAYSMAAGGPILDPEMEAMLLTPICPFSLSNRPIVIPSLKTLVIDVKSEQRTGVLLTIDGQDTYNLKTGDKIIIRRYEKNLKLIYTDSHTYYSALRIKLGGDNA